MCLVLVFAVLLSKVAFPQPTGRKREEFSVLLAGAVQDNNRPTLIPPAQANCSAGLSALGTLLFWVSAAVCYRDFFNEFSICTLQQTGPSVLARTFDNHSCDSDRKVTQLEPHFLADSGRSRLLHRHLPLCWVSCAVTEDCSAISYLKFALSSCSKGGQYSCCQSVCYPGSVCTQETTEKILIFVTLNIVVAMNNSVNQTMY